MNIRNPSALSALVAMVCVGYPAAVNGGTIGFVSEVNTNKGIFVIQNVSEPGHSIVSVMLHLGDNAEFGSVPVLATPLTPITHTHTYLSPALTLTITAPTDTGVVLLLTNAVASLASLSGARGGALGFTGFDAGDAFGFYAAINDTTSGGGAEGPDLNNLLLTVTFSNGQALSATYEGGPTANANSKKKSFPSGSSATALAPAQPIPLPGAVWMGMALLGSWGVLGRDRRLGR